MHLDVDGPLVCGMEGLRQMGNIAPRVAFEPTSLAFRASVLTTTPPRLPHALPTTTEVVFLRVFFWGKGMVMYCVLRTCPQSIIRNV